MILPRNAVSLQASEYLMMGSIETGMWLMRDGQQQNSLYNRASAAGTAGSGIGAGGLAAKNSGGDSQSTKFIIGFCVAVPCTMIIVGLYFFFKRRRNKRGRRSYNTNARGGGGGGEIDDNGARANGKARTKVPNAKHRSEWGRRREKKTRRFSFFKLPDRLKPVTPPAAYRREKELLPSGPP
ncbi:hypothetical protein JDV02_002443 [Purpureocillium takamizusanense]|uniref:Uncharacterized protein n=1 Tax=Purpureocillium takamizusanense TaxID=2060973 RepID=A0A9Q8QBL3_9HYPO|nr:uncharacterized protein JDV02_002443 [Purpureocillium takamizusanense]UNI15961.1 hypothetical protein JDV02_002443 [Purpureocillium takamizusanense]